MLLLRVQIRPWACLVFFCACCPFMVATLKNAAGMTDLLRWLACVEQSWIGLPTDLIQLYSTQLDRRVGIAELRTKPWLMSVPANNRSFRLQYNSTAVTTFEPLTWVSREQSRRLRSVLTKKLYVYNATQLNCSNNMWTTYGRISSQRQQSI